MAVCCAVSTNLIRGASYQSLGDASIIPSTGGWLFGPSGVGGYRLKGSQISLPDLGVEFNAISYFVLESWIYRYTAGEASYSLYSLANLASQATRCGFSSTGSYTQGNYYVSSTQSGNQDRYPKVDSLGTGQWVHIAYVYAYTNANNVSFQVWRNGVLDWSIPISGTQVWFPGSFRKIIITSSDQYAIASVRGFSTATDIAAHYAAGPTVYPLDAKFILRFTEGSGTTTKVEKRIS